MRIFKKIKYNLIPNLKIFFFKLTHKKREFKCPNCNRRIISYQEKESCNWCFYGYDKREFIWMEEIKNE